MIPIECLAPNICGLDNTIICSNCVRRIWLADRLVGLIRKGSMKLEWKNFMLDALDGSGLTTEEIQLFMDLSDKLELD
jgi:hypothetical protein